MSHSERARAPSHVREPVFFGCAVRRSGRDTVWIVLSGELDLAATSRLTLSIDEALASGRLVVVDLRQLTFMDSIGLRILVDAQTRARASERRVLLIRGPRQIDRLLEITGLRDHFEITDRPPTQATPARTATRAAA